MKTIVYFVTETIREALALAKHGDNAELIPAPNGFVLLRAKGMPEYAFLVWSDKSSGHRWHIEFATPEEVKESRSLITCLCCHLRAVEGAPKNDRDAYQVWKDRNEELFKNALLKVCQDNGITTIFVRHADVWHDRYSTKDDLQGLRVFEANECLKQMQELYGSQVILRELRFIDRKRSNIFESD